MTFLAPWALAAGLLGAVGTVLLHLVARQRPAAYLLPTARFIPNRQTLVSRATSRPRDLWLLALRVLTLLLAAAAFARPVFTGTPAARARIVLVDQSALVADPAGALRRARALGGDGMSTVLVAFDTTAALVRGSDSVARRPAAPGSITAALVAARRAAGALATAADSVELVLLSPVAASELDAATWAVRAQWPGVVRVERLAARADSAAPVALERAIPLADALGPALAGLPVSPAARAVRVRRAATADARDIAYARAGGTVVVWDSAAAPVSAQGLAVGDDVIVAPLGRRAAGAEGAVRARWADATPAAREVVVGAGCIRTVGVAVPASGDVALRPAFRRIVRALVAPCARPSSAPADSAALARLAGGGPVASARALADGTRAPSRLVSWLLGGALLAALLELALRRAPAREEEGA